MGNGSKERNYGTIRRQVVTVFLRDEPEFFHPVCDLAMPSPDGQYFLVRDLAGGEKAGKKGDSFDVFYPTATISRVEIRTKQYYLLPDGSRGEEVLDKEPEEGEINKEDK